MLSWFGDDYGDAWPILIILGLGQFLNILPGSVADLLSMSGHERDLRNVVLMSGSIAIIAAFVLTAYFGVTGAALSTVIAIIVHNLYAAQKIKHRLGFNILYFWRSVHSKVENNL